MSVKLPHSQMSLPLCCSSCRTVATGSRVTVAAGKSPQGAASSVDDATNLATKEELFDAVLDREMATIAEAAASAARAAGDPLASLRAGCTTWLRHALDPAVQRIALLDAPAVLDRTRWREIDEQHTLGRLRANIRRIADAGAIPADQVDMLANMVLAAVSEAALVIARHHDPDVALATGVRALDTLLTRVFAAR